MIFARKREDEEGDVSVDTVSFGMNALCIYHTLNVGRVQKDGVTTWIPSFCGRLSRYRTFLPPLRVEH